VARVEQLYPWPKAEVASLLKRYPTAEIIWAQEEPSNMGAARFVTPLLSAEAGPRPLSVVARQPSPSPATGSSALHELERADLIDRALGTKL
jgi:2-oxoglutarate dehydrogenase E1 component